MDSGLEWKEYAEAGIPEYWIVDPEAETITVYVLVGSAFEVRARARKGQAAASDTLSGCQVAVDEVFSAR